MKMLAASRLLEIFIVSAVVVISGNLAELFVVSMIAVE